ncbi:hypothetical protein CPC08DRAFT_797291, partial [Agrocybe pediades]
TTFEIWREEQSINNTSEWSPFASEEEWELAQWLMKSVGQTAVDDYLKLHIVKERCNLSFHNNYSFLKKVDALPTGPGWTCEIVTVVGDRVGEDGCLLQEELELWMRDPIEIVKDLIRTRLSKTTSPMSRRRCLRMQKEPLVFSMRCGQENRGGQSCRFESGSCTRNFVETGLGFDRRTD